MSNTILPPDPCLLAILLITKTRDGTSNVFHWPPQPGVDRKHPSSRHAPQSSSTSAPDHTATDSGNSDDSSSSSSSFYPRPHTDPTSHQHPTDHRDGLLDNGSSSINFDDSGSASPEKLGVDVWARHVGGAKRSNLLGLPDGFHHFLCPPDTFDRKRFEMTIDQLVFLGWPVYARKNGMWVKPKVKPKKPVRRESAARTAKSGETAGSGLRKQSVLGDRLAVLKTDDEGSGAESTGSEGVPFFESGYGHEEEEEEKPRREVLNMFHVAFVLSPSPLEYQRRVDEMYKCVVKKFSKALRWEQVRSDFVLKESERLKVLRSKHGICDAILKHSALARAIADLHSAISSSRIAQIDLTPRTSFSLQLPMPTSISVLPSLTEPQLPGVWLTTANSLASEDDIDTSGTRLASHFTLLPLEDPNTIIAELTAAQSPLAPFVANYLRHSTPTKSFVQISQSSNIPLSEIQHLASHLVYWRRARAIPPLHIRDIYITSPNADMRKLKAATAQYSKQFPALPSLPKMLHRLSISTPAPYSYILPSRDHKEAYLEILAWLMRGGWVTQLRTFAWIRVPAETRERARQKMWEEEKGKQAAKAKKTVVHRRQESRSESESGDSDDDSSSHTSDGPGEPELPSGYLTPMKSSIHSAVTADSSSSTKTAIPVQSDLRESEIRDDHDGPVLILDPKRASGMESRYLSALAEQIEEELVRDGKGVEGKEVREIWEKCVQYFNGQHALEKISSREGLKRKKVEALRAHWKNRGYLLEVRHW